MFHHTTARGFCSTCGGSWKHRHRPKSDPKVTPNCWAWQTSPIQPAHCTCVGCTTWREEHRG